MRLRLSLFMLLILVLLVPSFTPAANREMVELQRDIATLQDQVRTLQSSTAEKLTAMTVLMQQTLDAANNANKAVAVLESRLNSRLEQQSANVDKPLAVTGAKVDQMSNDFQSMRDSLTDVVSRMGKLEQRLVDLNNTVKTIQAPPPPPSGSSAAPAIPASTLFESAYRDTMGGRREMALKEFNDYVQAYGDTDKAPEAQFWIGQIYFEQNNFPEALKNFDAVLERYSSSSKTPDAMYMKGQTLVKMGKRDDGAKEFRALLAKYPNHELAARSCTQVKALGLSCWVPGAAATKKKARK